MTSRQNQGDVEVIDRFLRQIMLRMPTLLWQQARRVFEVEQIAPLPDTRFGLIWAKTSGPPPSPPKPPATRQRVATAEEDKNQERRDVWDRFWTLVARDDGDGMVTVMVPDGYAQLIAEIFPALHAIGEKPPAWSVDRQCISERIVDPDSQSLEFVAQHRLGLIKYAPDRVAPESLVVQIVLAFLDHQMAVLCPTRREASNYWRFLNEYIGHSVVRLRPGADDNSRARCFVGTFGEVEHIQSLVDHSLDLVICVDARTALHYDNEYALSTCSRARVFGFLPDKWMAPFDQKRLRAVFGFDEHVVLRNGFPTRSVVLQRLRFRGGKPLRKSLDPLELAQKGTWFNSRRNSRMSTIAKEALGGNDAPQHVVIIAANLDHAFALARRLPGWPILNRGMSVVAGLTKWQKSLLDAREVSLSEVEERLIATVDQVRTLPLFGFDIVVYAAGGRRLPDWLRAKSISGNWNCGPLRFVDIDDRHDGRLHADAEGRARTYRNWGWSERGPMTAADRVRAFIAERRGGSK